jgi:hypothetical protein
MSLNRAVAALLVAVFVIITLADVLAWSVQMHLLDPDVYVNVLDRAGFFEAPYALVRQGEIPEAGGLLLREGPLSVVSGAELEAIARELAPPDWLRTQLEEGIRDLIAVARTSERDELPDLVISLEQVKQRALGEPGDRALAIVIDALPLCGPDQTPLNLGRGAVVCKPAAVALGGFVGQLKSLLVPLVERIPDRYRLTWQPEQRETLEDLRSAGQTLEQLRFVLLLVLVLNMALLGLVWLLAVRAPAEWLRWTGIPLFLAGVLTLLLAWLVPVLVDRGFDYQSLWVEGDTASPLVLVVQTAVPEFVQLLFRPAQFVGLLLTGVGLLLAVVSPLFPGRRRVPPPRYRSGR